MTFVQVDTLKARGFGQSVPLCGFVELFNVLHGLERCEGVLGELHRGLSVSHSELVD